MPDPVKGPVNPQRSSGNNSIEEFLRQVPQTRRNVSPVPTGPLTSIYDTPDVGVPVQVDSSGQPTSEQPLRGNTDTPQNQQETGVLDYVTEGAKIIGNTLINAAAGAAELKADVKNTRLKVEGSINSLLGIDTDSKDYKAYETERERLNQSLLDVGHFIADRKMETPIWNGEVAKGGMRGFMFQFGQAALEFAPQLASMIGSGGATSGALISTALGTLPALAGMHDEAKKAGANEVDLAPFALGVAGINAAIEGTLGLEGRALLKGPLAPLAKKLERYTGAYNRLFDSSTTKLLSNEAAKDALRGTLDAGVDAGSREAMEEFTTRYLTSLTDRLKKAGKGFIEEGILEEFPQTYVEEAGKNLYNSYAESENAKNTQGNGLLPARPMLSPELFQDALTSAVIGGMIGSGASASVFYQPSVERNQTLFGYIDSANKEGKGEDRVNAIMQRSQDLLDQGQINADQFAEMESTLTRIKQVSDLFQNSPALQGKTDSRKRSQAYQAMSNYESQLPVVQAWDSGTTQTQINSQLTGDPIMDSAIQVNVGNQLLQGELEYNRAKDRIALSQSTLGRLGADGDIDYAAYQTGLQAINQKTYTDYGLAEPDTSYDTSFVPSMTVEYGGRQIAFDDTGAVREMTAQGPRKLADDEADLGNEAYAYANIAGAVLQNEIQGDRLSTAQEAQYDNVKSSPRFATQLAQQRASDEAGIDIAVRAKLGEVDVTAVDPLIQQRYGKAIDRGVREVQKQAEVFASQVYKGEAELNVAGAFDEQYPNQTIEALERKTIDGYSAFKKAFTPAAFSKAGLRTMTQAEFSKLPLEQRLALLEIVRRKVPIDERLDLYTQFLEQNNLNLFETSEQREQAATSAANRTYAAGVTIGEAAEKHARAIAALRSILQSAGPTNEGTIQIPDQAIQELGEAVGEVIAGATEQNRVLDIPVAEDDLQGGDAVDAETEDRTRSSGTEPDPDPTVEAGLPDAQQNDAQSETTSNVNADETNRANNPDNNPGDAGDTVRPSDAPVSPVADRNGVESETDRVVPQSDLLSTAPDFYLATPNADGSFTDKRIAEFDPSSVVFEARNIGNNRAELTISSDPIIQSEVARYPDTFLKGITENNVPETSQGVRTTQPAIIELQDGKWKLRRPMVLESLAIPTPVVTTQPDAQPPINENTQPELALSQQDDEDLAATPLPMPAPDAEASVEELSTENPDPEVGRISTTLADRTPQGSQQLATRLEKFWKANPVPTRAYTKITAGQAVWDKNNDDPTSGNAIGTLLGKDRNGNMAVLLEDGSVVTYPAGSLYSLAKYPASTLSEENKKAGVQALQRDAPLQTPTGIQEGSQVYFSFWNGESFVPMRGEVESIANGSARVAFLNPTGEQAEPDWTEIKVSELSTDEKKARERSGYMASQSIGSEVNINARRNAEPPGPGRRVWAVQDNGAMRKMYYVKTVASQTGPSVAILTEDDPSITSSRNFVRVRTDQIFGSNSESKAKRLSEAMLVRARKNGISEQRSLNTTAIADRGQIGLLSAVLQRTFTGSYVRVPSTIAEFEQLYRQRGGMQPSDQLPVGFEYKGQVVLNPDRLNLETPIHEYGHIWGDWAEKNDIERFNRGMRLIDQSPALLEEVQAEYPHLEGNELKKEALARLIGRAGAAKLQADPNLLNRYGEQSWIGRAISWLRDMWRSITNRNLATSGGWNNSDMTLGDFASQVAADLLAGRPIGEVSGEGLNELLSPSNNTPASARAGHPIETLSYVRDQIDSGTYEATFARRPILSIISDLRANFDEAVREVESAGALGKREKAAYADRNAWDEMAVALQTGTTRTLQGNAKTLHDMIFDPGRSKDSDSLLNRYLKNLVVITDSQGNLVRMNATQEQQQVLDRFKKRKNTPGEWASFLLGSKLLRNSTSLGYQLGADGSYIREIMTGTRKYTIEKGSRLGVSDSRNISAISEAMAGLSTYMGKSSQATVTRLDLDLFDRGQNTQLSLPVATAMNLYGMYKSQVSGGRPSSIKHEGVFAKNGNYLGAKIKDGDNVHYVMMDDAQLANLATQFEAGGKYAKQFQMLSDHYNNKQRFDLVDSVVRRVRGIGLRQEPFYWPTRSGAVTATKQGLTGAMQMLEDIGLLQDRSSRPVEVLEVGDALADMDRNSRQLTNFVSNAEMIQSLSQWVDHVGNKAVQNDPRLQDDIDYIKKYIEDINKEGRGGITDEYSPFERALLNNFNKSVFSFNIGTPAKQATGYTVGFGQGIIEDRYLAQQLAGLGLDTVKAYGGIFNPNMNDSNADLQEMMNNPYAQTAAFRVVGRSDAATSGINLRDSGILDVTSVDAGAVRQAAQLGAQYAINAYNVVRDRGLAPMYVADGVVMIRFYKAAKAQVMAQRGEVTSDAALREIGRLTNEIIDKTNSMNYLGDKTALQRSDSGLLRLMGMFSGQQQKVFNSIFQNYYDWFDDGFKWGPAAKKFMWMIGNGVIANAVMVSTISLMKRALLKSIAELLGREETKEERKERLKAEKDGWVAAKLVALKSETLRTTLGTAPGVFSTVGEVTLSLFDDEEYTSTLPSTPIVESANLVVESLGDLINRNKKGKGPTPSIINKLGRGATMLVGAPADPLRVLIDAKLAQEYRKKKRTEPVTPEGE